MKNAHLIKCPACDTEYPAGTCEEDDEFECDGCGEIVSARWDESHWVMETVEE